MGEPFFTIGHSNRTLEEFIALLRESDVGLVADVRKLPGSARYPRFDRDALTASLATAGIELRPAPGLAGRRPVSRDVPFDVNAWWDNRGFHNYADHALSEEFGAQLRRLRDWGRRRRLAVMCAEAVWWRCHRRIIADHLLARDETVFHILAPHRVSPARLTAGAVVADDLTVTYPRAS